jgi:hypothetical protein
MQIMLMSGRTYLDFWGLAPRKTSQWMMLKHLSTWPLLIQKVAMKLYPTSKKLKIRERGLSLSICSSNEYKSGTAELIVIVVGRCIL